MLHWLHAERELLPTIIHFYFIHLGELLLVYSQSIVGKWNQISSKQFLTAEGSKTHGKSVLETQMATIGTVVFEFKSDHTYVEKTSHAGDSRVLTFTGIWSLSGNQLELKLDPKQEDPKYNPKTESDYK